MENNVEIFKLLNSGKKIAPDFMVDLCFYMDHGILYMNMDGKVHNVYTDSYSQAMLSNLLKQNVKWREDT